MPDQAKTPKPSVAVVGQNGVGKSSLINAIVGKKVTPVGIIDTTKETGRVYECGDFEIWDVPGCSEERSFSNLRTIMAIREMYFILIVYIDRCEHVVKLEKFIRACRVPYINVRTKIDLITEDEAKHNGFTTRSQYLQSAFDKELIKLHGDLLYVSAHTNEHIEDLKAGLKLALQLPQAVQDRMRASSAAETNAAERQEAEDSDRKAIEQATQKFLQDPCLDLQSAVRGDLVAKLNVAVVQHARDELKHAHTKPQIKALIDTLKNEQLSSEAVALAVPELRRLLGSQRRDINHGMAGDVIDILHQLGLAALPALTDLRRIYIGDQHKAVRKQAMSAIVDIAQAAAADPDRSHSCVLSQVVGDLGHTVVHGDGYALRWNALSALRDLGKDGAGALSEVVKACGLDKDFSQQKIWAYHALTTIGPAAAEVSCDLGNALLHEQNAVCIKACTSALAAIGAVAELRRGLLSTGSGPEQITRVQWSARGLRSMGCAAEPAVLDLVQVGLRTDDRTVRNVVFRALGEMGHVAAAAVPEMKRALERGHKPRSDLQQAIRSIEFDSS